VVTLVVEVCVSVLDVAVVVDVFVFVTEVLVSLVVEVTVVVDGGHVLHRSQQERLSASEYIGSKQSSSEKCWQSSLSSSL
jgi:hypothetical protein